jgi:hypothetical protein
MPAPRVFVSSTCYDLADERDSVAAFCGGFGFEVAELRLSCCPVRRFKLEWNLFRRFLI